MRNSVSTRIAETLAQDIAQGAFNDAERFPTERDLAERFGVARNTIRRAMDTLESTGQISRQVGRGTFLTGTDRNWATAPGAETAGFGTQVPRKDISPRDLIEARLMIEPAAAAAAINATDSDIELLMRAQEASRGTDVMEEFERQDAEIHRLLFAMTHNHLVQQIEALIRGMRDDADWLAAKRRAYSEELKARYVMQHADIIDAVIKRSPKAAREAMTVHLEEVRRALLDG